MSGAAAHGVLVHDDGRILESDVQACSLLGYAPGDLPTFLSDLVVVGDRAAVRALGTPGVCTATVVRGDGALIPVELSLSALDIGGNRLALCTLRDLSGQQGRDQRLAAADAATTCFLAHMSHELRTPINAILGFAELIEQQMLGPLGDPAYLDYVRYIRASALTLFGTIESILEMSSLRTLQFGADDLHVVRCAQAVHEALGVLKDRVLIDAVDLDLTALDPAAQALVNPQAFQRVLVGLIDNALKFTPAGGVVRLACSTRLAATGPETVLSVADTGCGMDPDTIGQVCLPFHQGGTPMIADSRRGIGLGLALARRMVGLHGGRLEIDSAPGRGTVVHCILPWPADGAAHDDLPEVRVAV